jgi:hypothetical protein
MVRSINHLKNWKKEMVRSINQLNTLKKEMVGVEPTRQVARACVRAHISIQDPSLRTGFIQHDGVTRGIEGPACGQTGPQREAVLRNNVKILAM